MYLYRRHSIDWLDQKSDVETKKFYQENREEIDKILQDDSLDNSEDRSENS